MGNFRENRDLIKKYILKMYPDTTEQNEKELECFLEFVISNYDLDDCLYEQLEEDFDLINKELSVDGECLEIRDLESEEYYHNVIEPQLHDFNGGC